MKFSDILANSNFQDIAACIRGIYFGDEKTHSTFLTARAQLVEVTWPYLPGEWFDRFVDLQVIMAEKHKSVLSTANIEWLTAQLDGDSASAITALLMAYAAAPEEMVTPVEIAEATGTAESGWRNKAAAGLLPGAVKKGKQWLIPKRYAKATNQETQTMNRLANSAHSICNYCGIEYNAEFGSHICDVGNLQYIIHQERTMTDEPSARTIAKLEGRIEEVRAFHKAHPKHVGEMSNSISS